jgi:hypothetical protein
MTLSPKCCYLYIVVAGTVTECLIGLGKSKAEGDGAW